MVRTSAGKKSHFGFFPAFSSIFQQKKSKKGGFWIFPAFQNPKSGFFGFFQHFSSIFQHFPAIQKIQILDFLDFKIFNL